MLRADAATITFLRRMARNEYALSFLESVNLPLAFTFVKPFPDRRDPVRGVKAA
jgi:hypothetical protein